MQATYHIRIKKEYAAAIIEDLQKKDAVELLPEEETFQIPQWQIEEVRKSKEYYKQHPKELISWEEAWKMIKAD
jgi:hypothetical protein